jgi:hypothetical protein
VSPARLLAVVVLVSPSALGQNLRDVPLGGRTATMGGAGVAAGSDAAMPYLNPAGIAGTPHDLFSLSASAYAYSRASVKRFFRAGGFDPALGNVDVEEERFDIDHFAIIPSSAGYFVHIGVPADALEHVLALSVIATTYNDYEIDATFRATSPVGRLEEDFIATESFRQVFGGPSYAVAIQNRVRLGASVLVSYTTLEVDAHDLALFSLDVGGAQVPTTFNSRGLVDAYSIGLTGIAGVQVRAVQDLWFGAAWESWGIPLLGGGDYLSTTDASAFDAAGNQLVTRVNTRGEFDRFDVSRPTRISLGAAWDTPGVFAVAADVHFQPARARFLYGEVDQYFSQLTTGQPLVEQRLNGTIRYDTEHTWNLSAGAEYFVDPDVAVRAGVLTDRDIGAHADDGSPDARLDWTAFTLGLGLRDGTLESSYGLVYRLGTGRRPALDTFAGNATGTEVEYTAHGFMLILSGSIRTSEGEKERARRELREKEAKQKQSRR